MTDTFTPLKRSEIMSRISGKNTFPEIAVRKILYSLGCRYRLHYNKFVGKPDIVISKLKTVIFINGCFWHQHKGCKRRSVPKSNLEYWKDKLKFNVKKQKDDIKGLRELGWKVFIIWECETKKSESLYNQVKEIYEEIYSVQAG